MYYFKLFCILCIGFAEVTSAPLKNPSMYDAIAQKCPQIASIADFKTQHVFKACQNFTEIQQVDVSKPVRKNDLLCWFYYDTFTSYCSISKEINISVPGEVYTKYNLNQVCDNVAVILKQESDNLRKVLGNKENCVQTCGDEYTGLITRMCTISYYFGELTMAKLNSTKPTSRPNKPQLEQPDKQVPELKPENINAPSEGSNLEHKGEVAQKPPATSSVEPTSNQNPEPEKAPESVAVRKPETVEAHENLEPPAPANNHIPNEPVKQVEKEQSERAPLPVVPIEKTSLADHEEPVAEVVPPHIDVKPMETNVVQKPDAASNEMVLNNNVVIENGEDDEQNNNQGYGQPEQEIPQPNEMGDYDESPNEVKPEKPKEEISKPNTVDESESVSYTSEMDGDSYFFSYFMLLCVIFIVGYVCYHNKQKILALILEGRRGKRQYRSRRPNSANYHKLDSNLEEAITSTCSKNSTNVIY